MAARRPEIEEFDGISMSKIGARFIENKDECILWCRQYGLLATSMTCPRCDRECVEQRLASVIDGKTWRCTQYACKKVINIRKGSFFYQSICSCGRL